jgi:hypothetical protein
MAIFPGTPAWESQNCPGLQSRDFGRRYLPTAESDCNGLKQSCSPRRKLFNAVSHSQIGCREEVNSRLLVVGSQTASLTPGPSFAHNLPFTCPNAQCEPILDIYVSRAFQRYKESNKTLRFVPSTRPLKSRESTGTPSPKMGVALGV